MNQPRSGRPQAHGEFERARAAAVHADTASQVQAALTVAGHAVDAEDCRELLAMLGLSGTDGARTRRASDTQSVADGVSAFADELSGYLSAVAGALGVPADGVIFEVSDTATAYVALTRRSARWPGQDLMLLWSELRGWSLSVETRPAEPSVVLAGLGGDLVPAPRVVAAFVGDVLAGRRAEPVRPVVPMPRNRAELAARMREYVAS